MCLLLIFNFGSMGCMFGINLGKTFSNIKKSSSRELQFIEKYSPYISSVPGANLIPTSYEELEKGTELSLDRFVEYSMMEEFDREDRNFRFASGLSAEGKKIDAYILKTSNKRKKTRKTTNNGMMLVFDLGYNLFEHEIALRPDVNDNFKQKLMRASLFPLGILYFSLGSEIPEIGGISTAFLGVVLAAVVWYVSYRYIDKKNRESSAAMENTEFEKVFDVVCEDKLYARAFLDPSRMDTLLRRKNQHSRASAMSVLFAGGSMYVYYSQMKSMGFLGDQLVGQGMQGFIAAIDSGKEEDPLLKYLSDDIQHGESLMSLLRLDVYKGKIRSERDLLTKDSVIEDESIS